MVETQWELRMRKRKRESRRRVGPICGFITQHSRCATTRSDTMVFLDLGRTKSDGLDPIQLARCSLHDRCCIPLPGTESVFISGDKRGRPRHGPPTVIRSVPLFGRVGNRSDPELTVVECVRKHLFMIFSGASLTTNHILGFVSTLAPASPGRR